MIKLDKFDYFIFDKDGTLIDSIDKYVKNFVIIIKKHYNHIDENKIAEFFLKNTGKSLFWQIEKCLKLFSNKKDKEDLSKNKILEIERLFWKLNKKEDILFYKGVSNLIEKLYFMRKKIFLTTGGQDESSKKQLKKAKILDYFEVVLGSSNILKSKKHIKIFAKSQNLTLEEFSCKSCYIGDGILDLKIAKECNIFMIFVLTTFSKESIKNKKPNLIINSILDIEKFL